MVLISVCYVGGVAKEGSHFIVCCGFLCVVDQSCTEASV